MLLIETHLETRPVQNQVNYSIADIVFDEREQILALGCVDLLAPPTTEVIKVWGFGRVVAVDAPAIFLTLSLGSPQVLEVLGDIFLDARGLKGNHALLEKEGSHIVAASLEDTAKNEVFYLSLIGITLLHVDFLRKFDLHLDSAADDPLPECFLCLIRKRLLVCRSSDIRQVDPDKLFLFFFVDGQAIARMHI